MARTTNTDDPLRGGGVHVSRTRGAAGGVTLVVLGVWGLFIPFVGPYFDFAFTPDSAWTWTATRFWLEVLPGTVTIVGGLLMVLSANRVTTSLGAWLGVAGGAWFVVGREVSSVLTLGTPGTATGSSKGLRLLEELAFFTGLGTLIVFFAASALGRLSVRSVRDVRTAQRREAEREAREAQRTAQAAEAQHAAYVEGQRDAATQIAQAGEWNQSQHEPNPAQPYTQPQTQTHETAESTPAGASGEWRRTGDEQQNSTEQGGPAAPRS